MQVLQSREAEGATALASMQRLVEERGQQAWAARQALLHLQQDHAHLTSRLQAAQQQPALRCALCSLGYILPTVSKHTSLLPYAANPPAYGL